MPNVRLKMSIGRLAAIALAGLLLAAPAGPAPAAAAPKSYCVLERPADRRPVRACIHQATYAADVCAALSRNADSFGLPRGYFARLIWQESHFQPNALSSAGAEGIAQFIPSTARLQGLANPYNPAEALYRSARYLRVLRDKFGNLGLAAAAYNGGENRVSRFVSGGGYLAAETIDYVEIITGAPVTDWLAGTVQPSDFALDPNKPFGAACRDLAERGPVEAFIPPAAVIRPWGIQLAQFFSAATARRAFARLQARYTNVLGGEELMLVAKRNPNFGHALRYTTEVGRDNRQAAAALCAALGKAGGACLVVRN